MIYSEFSQFHNPNILNRIFHRNFTSHVYTIFNYFDQLREKIKASHSQYHLLRRTWRINGAIRKLGKRLASETICIINSRNDHLVRKHTHAHIQTLRTAIKCENFKFSPCAERTYGLSPAKLQQTSAPVSPPYNTCTYLRASLSEAYMDVSVYLCVYFLRFFVSCL